MFNGLGRPPFPGYPPVQPNPNVGPQGNNAPPRHAPILRGPNQTVPVGSSLDFNAVMAAYRQHQADAIRLETARRIQHQKKLEQDKREEQIRQREIAMSQMQQQIQIQQYLLQMRAQNFMPTPAMNPMMMFSAQQMNPMVRPGNGIQSFVPNGMNELQAQFNEFLMHSYLTGTGDYSMFTQPPQAHNIAQNPVNAMNLTAQIPMPARRQEPAVNTEAPETTVDQRREAAVPPHAAATGTTSETVVFLKKRPTERAEMDPPAKRMNLNGQQVSGTNSNAPTSNAANRRIKLEPEDEVGPPREMERPDVQVDYSVQNQEVHFHLENSQESHQGVTAIVQEVVTQEAHISARPEVKQEPIDTMTDHSTERTSTAQESRTASVSSTENIPSDQTNTQNVFIAATPIKVEDNAERQVEKMPRFDSSTSSGPSTSAMAPSGTGVVSSAAMPGVSGASSSSTEASPSSRIPLKTIIKKHLLPPSNMEKLVIPSEATTVEVRYEVVSPMPEEPMNAEENATRTPMDSAVPLLDGSEETSETTKAIPHFEELDKRGIPVNQWKRYCLRCLVHGLVNRHGVGESQCRIPPHCPNHDCRWKQKKFIVAYGLWKREYYKSSVVEAVDPMEDEPSSSNAADMVLERQESVLESMVKETAMEGSQEAHVRPVSAGHPEGPIQINRNPDERGAQMIGQISNDKPSSSRHQEDRQLHHRHEKKAAPMQKPMDSKVRICRKCQVHGEIIPVKGHKFKCPRATCECEKGCNKIEAANRYQRERWEDGHRPAPRKMKHIWH